MPWGFQATTRGFQRSLSVRLDDVVTRSLSAPPLPCAAGSIQPALPALFSISAPCDCAVRKRSAGSGSHAGFRLWWPTNSVTYLCRCFGLILWNVPLCARFRGAQNDSIPLVLVKWRQAAWPRREPESLDCAPVHGDAPFILLIPRRRPARSTEGRSPDWRETASGPLRRRAASHPTVVPRRSAGHRRLPTRELREFERLRFLSSASYTSQKALALCQVR